MSIAKRLTSSFIMVPCSCGRILRARSSQVGSEIRCWSCHQTTLVKIPRVRQRVLAQCWRNVMELLLVTETNRLVMAAGILTLGFMIPYAGLLVVGLLLIFGAAAYGDLIQASHTSRNQIRPDWIRIWRQTTLVQKLICVLFAVGTILPLWVFNASKLDSPHFSRSTWPILATTWLVLPVIMAATYADLEPPNTRRRDRFYFVLIHPLTLIPVLLLVPAVMLGLEAFLGWILYLGDVLPFFALEYMPVHGLPRIYNGVPIYGERSFFEMPTSYYLASYGYGLKHGYSLIAGVPTALSVPTNGGMNPILANISQTTYYILRVAIVFGTSLFLTMSFAIQARCLNVLINVRQYLAG